MGASYTRPAEVPSVHFPAFASALPSLQGKTIAITGCTTGTGLVAAKACAAKGGAVFLLNRPSPRAEAALAAVRAAAAAAGSAGRVAHIDCDLASFASVHAAAAALRAQATELDVLCNNAGVMALGDVATGDGYDVQMQTNHLSAFLLAKELFPLLEAAAALRGEARIVQHSSGARAFPASPLDAAYLGKNGGSLGGNGASMLCGGARWVRYHQTKLANAVFTLALADRLRARGSKVLAACAAPGLAATNLQVSTAADGGFGDAWIMRFAQSAEDGTMPLLTCMAAAGVESGAFFEPAGMAGPAKKGDLAAEKLSGDKAARAMLWRESEAACGEWPL